MPKLITDYSCFSTGLEVSCTTADGHI